MISISLCMIVKNEEEHIERCLNSVTGFADEIVIVDTGSVDRTKEIAAGFTDKIFDFEWIDDFSAARNFSFEQATKDYIMWLDADDIILPKDAVKLAALKKTISGVDSVMMKYNTGFDNQGNVTFSYFRERMVKRSCNFKWREPVHECLEIGGKVINIDICVTHAKKYSQKSSRNLQIYENNIKSGKELSPRGMYYYGRELKDHSRYNEAIEWFNKFLDTGKGWMEDNITACGEMAKCCRGEDKRQEALTYLFRSFNYDVPRAEICCQIGYHFKEQNNYKQAAFWFELILSLNKPKDSWGFLQHDCWDYIPCVECAVCYDKLGDIDKAAMYNDKAAEYKPDSMAVLYNKKYFDSVLKRGDKEG